MKKYVIKYADGREQRFIRDNYNSRKEAEEALLIYLCDHNEKCDDSSYLSPFDFTVEEVDVKEVNETITDFESARKALGIKPNTNFEVVNKKHSGKVAQFEDVARLVTDINPKHIKALIALNKLFTIAEAWNKEDEFVPDFSDLNQVKCFPWFKYKKDIVRFVFAGTDYTLMYTNANISSRLCFKTSKRAEQFGKQFIDIYNEIFL